MPRPVHPARTALAARGLTARDAADQLGISAQVLRSVLSHHKASWPKLRRQLAELLSVGEGDLFPDEVPSPEPVAR